MARKKLKLKGFINPHHSFLGLSGEALKERKLLVDHIKGVSNRLQQNYINNKRKRDTEEYHIRKRQWAESIKIKGLWRP